MSAAPGAVAETLASIKLVGTNRNLRRVNLALAASLIGDWAYATSVTVFTYTYGGASAVGAFVAIRMSVIAILLPLLTTYADRFSRKRFLVATDLLRMVVVSVAAVVILAGGPAVLVLCIAVVAGLIGSPFRPVQSALMPSLVRTPHELTAANAVSSTLESVAFFAGPALAGVLLGLTTVPVIFLVNAATFAWSALMLSGLSPASPEQAAGPVGTVGVARTEETAETAVAHAVDTDTDGDIAIPTATATATVEPAETSSFLREVAAGFVTIWRDSRLRLLMALAVGQVIVTGTSLVFTVIIAVEVLGTGPEGVGYLDAVMGVGAVAGGLVAISRARRGTAATDYGFGIMGWGLPLVVIAVWPHPIAAIVTMALIGAANPLVDVNIVTLLQRIVPEALLGRVFGALESLVLGGVALGAILMPLLITATDLQWALVLVGVPLALAAVLCRPSLRRIDLAFRAPAELPLVCAQPLFQPLPTSVQEELARNLERIEVPAGTAVISLGEVGDRFYLIESGELAAVRGTEELSRMGPGDCFGEIALLRDIPRTAGVVARTDAVVHALDREVFLTAIGAEPESSRRATVLADRRIVR